MTHYQKIVYLAKTMDTRNTSRMLLCCKEIKPIRCKKKLIKLHVKCLTVSKKLCLLRTELTGLIVAKSTIPGLLDKTFFAHWGDKKINSMITTSQLGKSYAD